MRGAVSRVQPSHGPAHPADISCHECHRVCHRLNYLADRHDPSRQIPVERLQLIVAMHRFDVESGVEKQEL